ncbi:methionyl-tRNA formyltransferase [Candidatus Saganbacteria bacterium CG08_land_8_20_14_0_20_45_16]|uniref:Methionyl-tRNA formyltransferase n=1 Tax=Candidatus Saganbacteria bacterium CG08_land_8_20_14_0_20_45_16 TaxID=2014293 RepID=A0A2H0XX67_UNCSA|nr:MAG: methionyl-tRNA formyltransferase [Candidatus Saganbacteria bacterium CG08_land_8_20_14_0_20_45_16]
MKIIFMGTPEPAAMTLKALIGAGHEIVLVVTQPDRKKGRGQKLSFSAVKEVALQNNLPLEQLEKVKNNKVFVSLLKSLKPEIIVVVAYGKILPKEILELPQYGCVNVHASLLPKYRGAAPVQWAILKGEKETGITIMKLDEGLDTGEIILQQKVAIEPKDTTLTLMDKLFAKGSKLLLKALQQINDGTVKLQKQNESEVTYAPLLDKEAGTIDWQKSSFAIDQRVRAMIPWPGAQTFFQGEILKIWQAKPVDFASASKPGTIVQIVKNQGFIVQAGSGALLVLEVQAAGKKRLLAYQFLIGHDVKIGETLPN